MRLQKAIMEKNGYTTDVTNSIKKTLASKTTKAAASTLEKINDTYFAILTNGQDYTVLSRYMVTQQEQKQIKNILKQEFTSADTVARRNENDWKMYKNAYQEEIKGWA